LTGGFIGNVLDQEQDVWISVMEQVCRTDTVKILCSKLQSHKQKEMKQNERSSFLAHVLEMVTRLVDLTCGWHENVG